MKKHLLSALVVLVIASLSQHSSNAQGGPINVLAMTYGTDQFVEFPRTIAAINTYFTNYTLTTTNTTNPGVLSGLLIGKNVLLIPEQEISGGNVWANLGPVIRQYLTNGGSVVFCGSAYSLSDVLYSTGVFTGYYAEDETGLSLNVLNTTDPLTTGLTTTSFVAPSGCYSQHITNTDKTTLVDFQGNDIVTYRYFGTGKAIYVGFDYYASTPETKRIIANAIKWACTSPADVICPNNTSVNAPSGFCRTAVNYSAIISGDPAPTVTYAFTGATTGNGNGTGSGTIFNLGVTHVVITASNCNVATCSFDITVTATIDDNNVCTIDACNSSTGIISHTTISITDNNACTTDGCDSNTGVFHNLVNIDDNNVCTTDACITSSGITTHTAINTNDNNACTVDGCDSFTGVFHNAVNSDDGNACTTDGCNTSSGVFHNAINTDDGNACTTDACNTSTGVITHTNVNTDDGNVCTIDECNISSGLITHTPVVFDDGNACTTDGCNTISGVYHDAVNTDDGNACTTDGCNTSTGVYHDAVSTEDFNACTIDGCNTLTGIFHDAVDSDDHNVCTTDGCDPVTGVYHIVIDVDDNDLCTSDGCNSTIGIYHNVIGYDDNNACTNDGCDPATGIYHHPVLIDDKNACTNDGCNTGTGIYHNNVETDDNNLCTDDGCDTKDGVYHDPVNIDDNNNCTVDACDPQTGIITHENTNLVVVATAGTISCYGNSTCVTLTATGGVPPFSGDGIVCDYTAGTYSFDVTDSRGCAGNSSISITEPPKITLSVLSTPSNGSDGTASILASGGSGSYSYIWSPGGQTNATATGLAPGEYCVIVTDINLCTQTICVTVGSACSLNAPGAITGPTGVCKKQNGVVYCVPPLTGATSYVWMLPAGVTVNGANNLPCITLKFSSKYKGGFICVKAVVPCGITDNSCLNVALINKKPITPGSITGPISICPNSTSTFSIAPVPNASGYQWKVNGNLTILSGQGTTSVVINAPTNFNGGTVKAKAMNCDGLSGERNKNVSKSNACKIQNSQIVSGKDLRDEDLISSMNIYPNPTSGKTSLTFNSKLESNFKIKWTDIIGKDVLLENVSTIVGYNSKELNLENLPNGIYFISVELKDERVKTLRLVKQ